MSEPRQIVQQSVYYQVVDYGHIRVKLAEVLNSRGVTRNRLRKLTGSSYEVVTRYYNADLKRVEMVDLDFMSRICYALDCTLEDLLEELENYYSELDAEFTERKLEGITILEAMSYEQHLRALERAIQTEQRKLDALRIQEEKKRTQVVEARKETATIEKLREHKLEDYRKAEQKAEEVLIDEFVSSARAHAAS